MSMVRAAVVQIASCVFDREGTLRKIDEWAAKAAAEGAQLVVFPEALLSGYPKGLSFGAVVGSRTAEGREDFRRYFDSAVDVPGEATVELQRIAAEHGLYMVVGVIERDGGTLYCTLLYLAPDGALLGKHRKLMPTAQERVVWGFGDGSTMPVFETEIGKLGGVICWENYMPLLRAHMFAQGVEIYCAPTADDRDTWLASMQHIAIEGRCYVLSACQYLTRGDCPADYASDANGDVLMRGGSSIVSPFGKVLAGPVFDQEALLVADLDMDEITRGKFDFDVSGHYSRPDVFRLEVDLRERKSVVARGHPPESSG